MLAAVISGFLLAAIMPSLHKLSRKAAAALSVLLPLALFLYFCLFIGRIISGEVITSSYSWAEYLGVNLSFRLDGLSLLFALVITGIGLLVMLYSSSYLAGDPRLGTYYGFMLGFMGSMLGVVLSDNLIAFFVFWELTSIASYLLIGYDHEKDPARRAAWQALLVTDSGGYALLLGLLLLWRVGGSYEFASLLSNAEAIRSSSLYYPIFLLILLGALTKSAQFPFHFWLPNAMEAPTPVSTYLHSATMVKAGIYLLARFYPLLGGTTVWFLSIVTAGAITMVLGGVLALKETDLKRILAYSTVSILGAITFLLGIGTISAVVAALLYLLVHAIYKAALFLVAGLLDHGVGTRDIRKLGGLAKAMPITALAGGLAALSMAGFPLVFGFIGKEYLYAATLESPLAAIVLTALAFITSILLVIAAGIVGFSPFLGHAEYPRKPHEGPSVMWIGPLVLAGIGVLLGLFPGLAAALVSPAAASVFLREIPVKLVLFHGLDVKLLLSGLTLALGIILYSKRTHIRRAITRYDQGEMLGPSRLYDLAHVVLNGLARAQTRILQNGHLHFYLLTIILTTIAFVGFPLAREISVLGFDRYSDIHLHELMLGLVLLISIGVIVYAPSRFYAVVALGAVGYSLGIIYLLFGAPDLAITQFSVDTLTVILLVLVLYPMPPFEKFSRMPDRIRDAAGALAAGILMTVLTLSATAVSGGSRLAPFFAQKSALEANGRNIVNIVLVDFRALDTMGEITVLTVAAVGVFSLLKLRLNKK